MTAPRDRSHEIKMSYADMMAVHRALNGHTLNEDTKARVRRVDNRINKKLGWVRAEERAEQEAQPAT